jgi:hypothetical protein
MLNAILTETDSKAHIENLLAEAEHRRFVQAVQATSKSSRPQRKRLPKTSTLRKLVTSLGHSAP